MPAPITDVQLEELRLLRAIHDGQLQEYLGRTQADLAHDIARELHEEGMFNGDPFRPISGRSEYPRAKITSRGRDRLAELEQLAVGDHAREPARDAANHKRDVRLGDPQNKISPHKIAEGVIAGLLVLFVAYLLSTHLGLLK